MILLDTLSQEFPIDLSVRRLHVLLLTKAVGNSFFDQKFATEILDF